jgi:hypothetical protein
LQKAKKLTTKAQRNPKNIRFSLEFLWDLCVLCDESVSFDSIIVSHSTKVKKNHLCVSCFGYIRSSEDLEELSHQLAEELLGRESVPLQVHAALMSAKIDPVDNFLPPIYRVFVLS